jgi:hypothetical protein
MEEKYKKEEQELLSRKKEIKSETASDAGQIKDEDLES